MDETRVETTSVVEISAFEVVWWALVVVFGIGPMILILMD
jgi:hypothetical protein